MEFFFVVRTRQLLIVSPNQTLTYYIERKISSLNHKMRLASTSLLLSLAQLTPVSAFSNVQKVLSSKKARCLSASQPGWIDNPAAPVNSEESLKITLEKSLEGSKFRKHLSLLGSTGSIGTQTLDIVQACPDNFVVEALSAGTNVPLMAQQVMQFQPKLVSMATSDAAQQLRAALQEMKCPSMPDIVHGQDGIIEVATIGSADTVVTGIVGAAGLQPTIEAIKLKKDIALANKETLISGGPVINPLVAEYGVHMLPADSEHSAIFQCLQGVPPGGLRRIILTASGGAFRDYSKDELFRLCAEDPSFVQKKATTHPNWDMGAKITLDSATMMNKGLEVSLVSMAHLYMIFHFR
jgi:1-deoxy-D-xylulose-5-phosphate reductoisomerase